MEWFDIAEVVAVEEHEKLETSEDAERKREQQCWDICHLWLRCETFDEFALKLDIEMPEACSRSLLLALRAHVLEKHHPRVILVGHILACFVSSLLTGAFILAFGLYALKLPCPSAADMLLILVPSIMLGVTLKWIVWGYALRPAFFHGDLIDTISDLESADGRHS